MSRIWYPAPPYSSGVRGEMEVLESGWGGGKEGWERGMIGSEDVIVVALEP